jgi:hypothetical protein
MHACQLFHVVDRRPEMTLGTVMRRSGGVGDRLLALGSLSHDGAQAGMWSMTPSSFTASCPFVRDADRLS